MSGWWLEEVSNLSIVLLVEMYCLSSMFLMMADWDSEDKIEEKLDKQYAIHSSSNSYQGPLLV